jgi:hypothetical protein
VRSLTLTGEWVGTPLQLHVNVVSGEHLAIFGAIIGAARDADGPFGADAVSRNDRPSSHASRTVFPGPQCTLATGSDVQ